MSIARRGDHGELFFLPADALVFVNNFDRGFEVKPFHLELRGSGVEYTGR